MRSRGTRSYVWPKSHVPLPSRAISLARGHLRVSRFARRTTEKRETARSLKTIYCWGECKHYFNRQLHYKQVAAVVWELQNSSPTACVWRWHKKIDLCAQINLKQYQLTAMKHTYQLRGRYGHYRTHVHNHEPQKGRYSCPWLPLPGWYGCAHA